MSQEQNNSIPSYGVIIGRFQVPQLTDGHRFIIDEVSKRHNGHLIILVGQHQSQPTRRNPLDYLTRMNMLKQYCSATTECAKINDSISDELWSQNIDAVIGRILRSKGSPYGAVIYGSRDSFIKHYHGIYPVVELESPFPHINATAIREECGKKIDGGELFRHGVIYGIHSRFASPYLTVDIAVIKDGMSKCLLGKKKGESLYRFIGGFVDATDNSISAAAIRELNEETGGEMTTTNMCLIGEAKIDDWRYKSDVEKIFTNLFICEWTDGIPKASDDIAELDFLNIDDITDSDIMPAHRVLFRLLTEYLKNYKPKFKQLTNKTK